MAGKGDVLRPMAVKQMTGVWPGEERDSAKDEAKPCRKCGRDVRDDDAIYMMMDNYSGVFEYECRPKCPA